MEKIPSLLGTELERSASQWVYSSTSASATIMYDGTGYAIINGVPYRHYALPFLQQGGIVCSVHNNLWYGWEPVPQGDDTWWQVWQQYEEGHFDWSYELTKTSTKGGSVYTLRPHGKEVIYRLPTTLEAMKKYLTEHKQVEGIVWWEDTWNINCRKAKIQRKDLSLP